MMLGNDVRAPEALSSVHKQLLGNASRSSLFLHDSFEHARVIRSAVAPVKHNFQLSIPRFQYRNGHTVFYEIRVTEIPETPSALSDVMFHRFDDFAQLQEKLTAALPSLSSSISLPSLPPKRMFGNWSSDFIESRRAALEEYLLAITKQPEFAVLQCVRDFLPPLCTRFMNENSQSSSTSNKTNQSDHCLKFLCRRMNRFAKDDQMEVLVFPSSSRIEFKPTPPLPAEQFTFHDLVTIDALDPLVHNTCTLHFVDKQKELPADFQMIFDSPDELARFHFCIKALLQTAALAQTSMVRAVMANQASAPASASASVMDLRKKFEQPSEAAAPMTPPSPSAAAAEHSRNQSLEFRNPLRATSLNFVVPAAAAPAMPVKHLPDYPSIPAALKINVVTWNTAGMMPLDSDFPKWLPAPDSDFDIIAVGFQECLYGNPLTCESDIGNRILSFLNSSSADVSAVSAPGDFYLLAAKSLWEIRMFVFVRRRLQEFIHHLQSVSVATGLFNVMGNKGACAIAFRFAHRSFAFITSHLAPHHGPSFLAARNRMYREISGALRIGHNALELTQQFDALFWCGDFNYRIDLPPHHLVDLIARRLWGSIQLRDQLRTCRLAGSAFPPNIYREAALVFAPTYKLRLDKKKQKSVKHTHRRGPSAGAISLPSVSEDHELHSASLKVESSKSSVSWRRRPSQVQKLRDAHFSVKHGLWLTKNDKGLDSGEDEDDDAAHGADSMAHSMSEMHIEESEELAEVLPVYSLKTQQEIKNAIDQEYALLLMRAEGDDSVPPSTPSASQSIDESDSSSILADLPHTSETMSEDGWDNQLEELIQKRHEHQFSSHSSEGPPLPPASLRLESDNDVKPPLTSALSTASVALSDVPVDERKQLSKRETKKLVTEIAGRQFSSARIPSWCDRILSSSVLSADRLQQTDYHSCVNVHSSDHVPVCATYIFRAPPPLPLCRPDSAGCVIQFSALEIKRVGMRTSPQRHEPQTEAEFDEMDEIEEAEDDSKSDSKVPYDQVYLSFHNRAILAHASEAARTGYGKLSKVDPGECVSVNWEAQDLPLLTGIYSKPEFICHETCFVVIKSGSTDNDPSFGQAALSLNNIMQGSSWRFCADVLKNGVVNGQLCGQITVIS